MDETNDVPEVEETLDLPEVEEGEEDTTDWKAEAQKLREKAIAQRERTKALKAQLAEAKKVVTPTADKQRQPTTGELDETALDYLDLKGITEQEDIDVIQKVVQRTGQTVRQALKDEYVTSKLDANRAKREVKEATPSSTKRSGATPSTDIAAAIAKYESTGQLPDDFTLRSAVVNALVDKSTTNKPAWH